MTDIRALAIYLPQFHPVPENNEWWGKGFTEWTNVTKAKPRFKGHYQPHLPADLGFYDLRVPSVQQEQIKLAKEYGISGFCYYHYWFNGKRILERPVDELLKNTALDFPFCLCWANENWTKRWDGRDEEVLLKQTYSEEDNIAHINFLKKYFTDPRYIKVDGKPVFIVYRPSLFPDIKKTTACWREECRKNGVGEIYLAFMQSFGNFKDPAEIGFDAAIEFQPNFSKLPQPRYIASGIKKWTGPFTKKASSETADRIFLYEEVAKRMMNLPKPSYKLFPGIFPMWDNSSRRKENATIIHQSTPELYRAWLKHIVENFKPFSKDENFIFLNAWNEWAEGNHLEPCREWGRAYLEATKKILRG
jgi:lipopolysaccharide biosynthesis protein